jgi:acyl-CoA dehydrogenase
MAFRVADRALQIHGGAGYMAEYPIERLFRDARLLRIYEGTSQIQQVIIARRMVKEFTGRA